jgi:superfamily II DNA or RNA helicase
VEHPGIAPGRGGCSLAAEMIDWNESTLRAAASWQAFKEGKSLLGVGAVAEAKAGEAGWQGAVKSGSRLMRVKVTVRSATDIETRCACPENQRTGALCAHAVAVGLAVKQVKVPAAPASPARVSSAAVEVVPRPWRIALPENWRQALSRGRLAATLTEEAGGEVDPADERLCRWIAREAGAAKPQMVLSLEGDRLESFLQAVNEHPRVVAGAKRESVEIRMGAKMRLGGTERTKTGVRLVPAADEGGWEYAAGAFRRSGAATLWRMGEGGMPEDLRPAIAVLARGEAVEVPLNHFLGHLDAWQEWLNFDEGTWIQSVHFVPAPAKFELTLEGTLQSVSASLRVRYGDAPAVPPGEGAVLELPRLVGEVCQVRDLPAEQAAIQRIESAGFIKSTDSIGCWLLRGEAAVLRFVSRELPQISANWSVRETGNPLSKQVVVVHPRIEILGSGEDWLSFDLKFQTNDGISVPVDEVRRLLASGRRQGSGSGGRRVVVSDDLDQLVDPLFSEIDLRQEEGHFVTNSRSGNVIRELRKKLDNRHIYNDSNDHKAFVPPVGLMADLRPYQLEGAAWLADRVERFGGALLADDMGLGKTIQTIALIEHLFAKGTGVVLVVATASLLGNWRAEFGRFAPGRGVRVLHGTGRDRERERVGEGEVVLTSYGTLARDLAWHLSRDYLAVVVDEASLMRNPDTDHAKAVSKLRSGARVALTGTPVENGVRDLWSIFRFIQPGWLGGREEFRERYEVSVSGDAPVGPVLERLRLRASPFLLRRTKEQVAPELPSKILIDEFCDLSADQKAVYKELLTEGRKRVEAIADAGNRGAARMQMLTALLRLRQTCCDLALLGNDRFKQLLPERRSAKLHRLLGLIEEAIAGGHRMLVFSQFQTQLREIEKCMEARGWESLRLDGQSRNRQEMVDRFQSASGPPVFLISLKAGGYGLNLTAADTVVHFDPWWNPAAEAQATDRAHRIGQVRPVTVYRLLARDTVEEKVLRLQARKRDLAAAVDEAGMSDGAGWSMEELASVLGG